MFKHCWHRVLAQPVVAEPWEGRQIPPSSSLSVQPQHTPVRHTPQGEAGEERKETGNLLSLPFQKYARGSLSRSVGGQTTPCLPKQKPVAFSPVPRVLRMSGPVGRRGEEGPGARQDCCHTHTCSSPWFQRIAWVTVNLALSSWDPIH
jgi:hypothetical protein